jgi:hypothetical protein
MSFVVIEGSLDLRTVEFEKLVDITYYFGLKGCNMIKSREKIIDKLNLAIGDKIEIMPTDEMLREYKNAYRRNKVAKKAKADTKKDGVINEDRVRVIISSRDEDETEEVFSINEYTVRIKFDKEVEIPKSMYEFIKNIEEYIYKPDELNRITKRVVKKYIIQTV